MAASREVSMLLVDDDASFLLSMRRLLEATGGEDLTVVATAANADAALQAARRLKPGAVVLEPALGGPGFELISRLRELLPGSVLLAVSASEAASSSAAQARAAGADDFVPKRRVAEHLLPALRRAMVARLSGGAPRD